MRARVSDASDTPRATLPKVLEAIENGAAYVNVHTMDLPGGEIRGQIEVVPAAEAKEKK